MGRHPNQTKDSEPVTATRGAASILGGLSNFDDGGCRVPVDGVTVDAGSVQLLKLGAKSNHFGDSLVQH
jgi:hypothetical protein